MRCRSKLFNDGISPQSLMVGALIAEVSGRHPDPAPVVALSRHVADGRSSGQFTALVPVGRVLLHAGGPGCVLLSLQIFSQEILFLSLFYFDGLGDLLGQFVLDAATADFWDLVMRVRTSDLIGPLHFLGLDH